ncbi:MAG: peptidoglycan-associated lipoprotein Pal [Acidobacteria bacterium]|nr:peptidoglycan-associated lipoprotein Pal [Acidobacteriota bacterium]
MNLRRGMRWSGILLLLLLVTLAGCKKKPAAPPPTPPPPPAPAAPTATLRATPSVIEQGQSTTLSWNSTNATELQLAPGIGSVGPQGSTAVTPERSTTYTLTATGPGGRQEASARVTVNVAVPPPARPARISLEEAFVQRIRHAFFDFDKADLRPDARVALTQSAEFLREYPEARVLIEGHCDERGSTEYNLGLGDRRANAAKDFLVSLGISASRIQTVSYGKERPFCFESNEECWQENRRAHFVLVR